MFDAFKKAITGGKATTADLAAIERGLRDELAQAQRDIADVTDALVLDDSPELRAKLAALRGDADVIERRIAALAQPAADAQRREALASYEADCQAAAALDRERQDARTRLQAAREALRQAKAAHDAIDARYGAAMAGLNEARDPALLREMARLRYQHGLMTDDELPAVLRGIDRGEYIAAAGDDIDAQRAAALEFETQSAVGVQAYHGKGA